MKQQSEPQDMKRKTSLLQATIGETVSSLRQDGFIS